MLGVGGFQDDAVFDEDGLGTVCVGCIDRDVGGDTVDGPAAGGGVLAVAARGDGNGPVEGRAELDGDAA